MNARNGGKCLFWIRWPNFIRARKRLNALWYVWVVVVAVVVVWGKQEDKMEECRGKECCEYSRMSVNGEGGGQQGGWGMT